MFPKYKLTDKQIKGIANIVLHEQGTIEGWYAEASQIANRTDIKGDKYATGENAVKTVTSGWYAKGKTRYNTGTNNKTVIQIVKNVFCKGLRTLPRYIDEHDCMSDISSVKNGNTSVKSNKAKWIRHKTIIRNRMGAKYYFYDFPGGYKTGVDPFGYTNKDYRVKYGDICFTVKQAEGLAKMSYSGILPKLPDKTFGVDRDYYKYGDGSKTLKDYKDQIKLVQECLMWAGKYKGKIDGIYLSQTQEAVEKLQKANNLQVNGKFGKKCLSVIKNMINVII